MGGEGRCAGMDGSAEGWARMNARSEVLVRRFHAGDLDAVAALHVLWAGRLEAFFTNRLDDPHEAQDAVQTLALTLIVQLERYDIEAPGAFGAWLFSIAGKQVANERRRRRRVDVAAPGAIAREQDRERVEPDVADLVESWAVRDALRRLPDRQRVVLRMHAVLGMTVAEIAASQDMSPDAVYKTLERARAALSAWLRRPSGETRVDRSPMTRRDVGQPVLDARRRALALT